MNIPRMLKIGILLTALSFLSFPAPLSSGPTPENLVNGFHETLLGTMKQAASTGIKQRFDKLQPSISESFHLPLMIQVASSSFWRKASKQQRDKLINVFSRLSVATYAAQFNGYSGQSFKTLGSKPGPQKTVLVDTQITNPGGDHIALTYVTRYIKGNWRIIDVLVDTGISELARKRSEYRGILKSNGIPGLIQMLKAKADTLLNN